MSAFKERYAGSKNSSGRWVLRPPAEYATRRTIVRHIPFRASTSCFGSLQVTPSPATGVLYGRGRLAKWDSAYWADGALTNLITNPSIETNTTGYTSAGTVTLTRVSTYAFDRSYSLRWQYTSGTRNVYNNSFTFSANTAYTFSVCVRRPSGSQIVAADLDCYLEWVSGAPQNVAWDAIHYVGNGWWKCVKSFTTTGTISTSRVGCGNIDDNDINFDGWSLTATSYEVPYFDGASGTGFSWSGTADASTSTKIAANLRYSTTSLANSVMTIAGWFRFSSFTATQYLWDMSTSDTYAMYTNGTGVELQFNGSFLQFLPTANTWCHLAITKSGTTGKAYLNGVEVSSVVLPSLSSSVSMCMGHSVAGSGHLKGGISDFFVAHTAFSGTDLLSIYNSTRPFYSNNARPVDVPFTVKIS